MIPYGTQPQGTDPATRQPGWYPGPQPGQRQWWNGYAWGPPRQEPKKSRAGRVILVVSLVVVIVSVIIGTIASLPSAKHPAAKPGSLAAVTTLPAGPAQTEPPAVAAVAIPLAGKGGVKTSPFTLRGGVQYRVDYQYGSSQPHGIEMCIWMPHVSTVKPGHTFLEMLPNGQGAMAGSTTIYPAETADVYLDMSATMAACSWTVTFTPAG